MNREFRPNNNISTENPLCYSTGNYYTIPEERLNEAISFDMTEALRTCKLGCPGRSVEEKGGRRRLAVMLCRNHPDSKCTTIFFPGEAESLMKKIYGGKQNIIGGLLR